MLLHSDVCCSNQLLLHDKLSPNLVVDNPSHLAAYSPAIWAGLSWAVFLDLTTIWHASEFKGAHRAGLAHTSGSGPVPSAAGDPFPSAWPPQQADLGFSW